jgi:transcriptional regulator with XRE-family HTH domain
MQGPTPYIPQPAKAELVLRRLTNRDIAQRLGVSEVWVGRVLNGRVPPPERFRRDLAELLNLPEERLFRRREELFASTTSGGSR